MKRAVPYTPVLWGGILWAVVTGVIMFAAIWMAYLNHLFAVGSRPVQGSVIDKHITVSHGGRGGPTYTYHVTYRYDVGDKEFRCQSTVLPDTYNHLTTYRPIPIKYLIQDPARNRVDLSGENKIAVLHALAANGFGLLILVWGLCWLIFSIRRNRLRERLIRQGVSCLGKVTSLETEQVGKSTFRVYLKISFQDNRGREVEGRTWDISRAQENLWRAGNPVRVYYDAENSDRFTVDLDGSTLLGAGESRF